MTLSWFARAAWVARAEHERVVQQNLTLQAQLELLQGLLADARHLQAVGHQHTGQLLALTADHARLQTTTDHLAQLLTLNQGEKAVMLERLVAGVHLPTPEFAVAHSAPPMPFEGGSPASGLMATIPGIAAGVPADPSRNAIGDALNRLRDERDAQREKGQGTSPTPGIFDDLGDTAEEVAANEQRLST